MITQSFLGRFNYLKGTIPSILRSLVLTIVRSFSEVQDALTSEIDKRETLTELVQSNTDNIKVLQSNVQQISEVSSHYKDIENKVSELSTSVKNVEGVEASNSSKIDGLSSQVKDLDTRVSDNDRSIKDINQQISNLDFDTINAVVEKTNNNGSDIKLLKVRVEANTDALNDIQGLSESEIDEILNGIY